MAEAFAAVYRRVAPNSLLSAKAMRNDQFHDAICDLGSHAMGTGGI
jgi:hypothetical protein